MQKIVGTYMKPNPISVKHSDSLNTIIERMDSKNLSHLLVTDKDNELKGVISKGDLLSRIRRLSLESSGNTYANIKMNDITADDIMTKDVITVKEDDALEYAVELLLQKQFHCLPVIQKEQAVGIITSYDLMKGYYEKI